MLREVNCITILCCLVVFVRSFYKIASHVHNSLLSWCHKFSHYLFFFFFSSRRRHTRLTCDWSSDVCSSDLKIHEILRENNLQPDETLFIGDMEHDIATARHGGIHSCAVLTGYNTLEQLRAARSEERRVGKECRCRWSREH